MINGPKLGINFEKLKSFYSADSVIIQHLSFTNFLNLRVILNVDLYIVICNFGPIIEVGFVVMMLVGGQGRIFTDCAVYSLSTSVLLVVLSLVFNVIEDPFTVFLSFAKLPFVITAVLVGQFPDTIHKIIFPLSFVLLHIGKHVQPPPSSFVHHPLT